MKEPTWNELIEEYKATIKELVIIEKRMEISGHSKHWQSMNASPNYQWRFGQMSNIQHMICQFLDQWRDPIIP